MVVTTTVLVVVFFFRLSRASLPVVARFQVSLVSSDVTDCVWPRRSAQIDSSDYGAGTAHP